MLKARENSLGNGVSLEPSRIRVDFGRLTRCLVAGIACIHWSCFTYRDVVPPQPFPMTHGSEKCDEQRAQGCYEEGVALVAGGRSTAERTRGIALLDRACGVAKLPAACQTLEQRFKRPKKISGEPLRYTRVAAWDGIIGTITLKCLLTTEGVLKECAVVAPRTEKEREILEESGQAAQFLKALSTWRFTPAEFDGQPCEVEHLLRVHMQLR